MECPKCGGKMVGDRAGFYGEKIANSTLYVCTGLGCGRMLRKDHTPKLPRQRKPLKG